MSDPFDLAPAAPWNDGPERRDDFSPGPAGSDALEVGSPPAVWLAASAVAALVGGALAAFVLHDGWVTLVPWLLAGPVGIVQLGIFSIVDTRRRSMPVYSAGAWVRPVYAACVVIVLVGVVAGAINIALWMGRL